MIASSELPVANFQLVWRTDPGILFAQRSRIFAVIQHSTTESLFGIKKIREGKFWVRYQVGADNGTGEKLFPRAWGPFNSNYKWETVLAEVQKWTGKVEDLAKKLEQYESTPDLWEELNRSKNFFTNQSEQSTENAPFTPAEQADISAQIKQVENYLKATHELTSEQISHIETRLDQAEQASRRLGRKDWLMTFNGVVFSLILTDLITPQTAQHVMMMSIHGLSHLFGIGGPPPHLPSGG